MSKTVWRVMKMTIMKRRDILSLIPSIDWNRGYTPYVTFQLYNLKGPQLHTFSFVTNSKGYKGLLAVIEPSLTTCSTSNPLMGIK